MNRHTISAVALGALAGALAGYAQFTRARCGGDLVDWLTRNDGDALVWAFIGGAIVLLAIVAYHPIRRT
jgi:hypothetical protein